jgi:hypothetical protein
MTTSSTTTNPHLMIRSREMSLLQEDLARARLAERLAEAEASRASRAARARRRERALAQAGRRPVTRATYRARLFIGLGRAASTR